MSYKQFSWSVTRSHSLKHGMASIAPDAADGGVYIYDSVLKIMLYLKHVKVDTSVKRYLIEIGNWK